MTTILTQGATVGRLLKYSHKPKTIDYLAKFGLLELPQTEYPVVTPTVQPTKAKVNEVTSEIHNKHLCSKCNSPQVSVVYGRYGYYFKCSSCEGNTSIKLSCISKDCKPRIRKSKNQFFEQCGTCGTEQLFFVNQAEPCSGKIHADIS